MQNRLTNCRFTIDSLTLICMQWLYGSRLLRFLRFVCSLPFLHTERNPPGVLNRIVSCLGQILFPTCLATMQSKGCQRCLPGLLNHITQKRSIENQIKFNLSAPTWNPSIIVILQFACSSELVLPGVDAVWWVGTCQPTLSVYWDSGAFCHLHYNTLRSLSSSSSSSTSSASTTNDNGFWIEHGHNIYSLGVRRYVTLFLYTRWRKIIKVHFCFRVIYSRTARHGFGIEIKSTLAACLRLGCYNNQTRVELPYAIHP